MSNPIVIAIDGPASSGKSTMGFLLAKDLGYQFVDSGLIYRVGCAYILEKGIDILNISMLEEVFQNMDIHFYNEGLKQRITAFENDYTNIINTPEITKIVPVVGANHTVREKVQKIQRTLGADRNTVMVGRDIGSTIFPNTPHKFFITASAEIRAQRRYKQLIDGGTVVTYETVFEDIKQRDLKDTTRESSPMIIPESAIVIDTSTLSMAETVNMIKITFLKNIEPNKELHSQLKLR
ncbi:MAG: (d)CMP kinase [Candidatus Paceibacterota bacterium]|jgi:cytidylate kinase